MKKLFATFLLTCSLFAAEEGGTAAAESMDIWKWLNFALLAGILGWLIAKNLGPVLVTRSAQIREGLAAGEKAKADAEARAAAVQAKLATLGQSIAEMKTSAKEEREREADRIRRETAAELQRIQAHAKQDVESAGKLARLEMQRYAAKLAIDLAEQKVRARMSPEKQAELLNRFIGEIADSSAQLG